MSLVIHRLRRVDSTQAEARRLVESGRAGAGHVVVADEQTEGRGRFGRTWSSPVGGLYATFVVPHRPMLPIASGLGLLRALDRFGVKAGLEWPNDLVVDDKKLAGILIETAGEVALIGIGVNLVEAPLETAVSVRAAGGDVRRGELVVAIGEELDRGAASEECLPAYRESLLTLGRAVRVTAEGGETIEGTAVDVDAEGRLLVETRAGVCTIPSGECVHLRS
jgi:BirA family biotin operon repressor/biotin-[acetyl-CoA-carboxylase] ligase